MDFVNKIITKTNGGPIINNVRESYQPLYIPTQRPEIPIASPVVIAPVFSPRERCMARDS